MHSPAPWLYRGKSDSVHVACDTHPYGQQIFRFHSGFNEDESPRDEDLALVLTAPQLLMALEDAIAILEPLAEQLPSVRSRVEGYFRIIRRARDLEQHQ